MKPGFHFGIGSYYEIGTERTTLFHHPVASSALLDKYFFHDALKHPTSCWDGYKGSVAKNKHIQQHKFQSYYPDGGKSSPEVVGL
jgi:hypothetical protein